jgi:hypothetical protein
MLLYIWEFKLLLLDTFLIQGKKKSRDNVIKIWQQLKLFLIFWGRRKHILY